MELGLIADEWNQAKQTAGDRRLAAEFDKVAANKDICAAVQDEFGPKQATGWSKYYRYLERRAESVACALALRAFTAPERQHRGKKVVGDPTHIHSIAPKDIFGRKAIMREIYRQLVAHMRASGGGRPVAAILEAMFDLCRPYYHSLSPYDREQVAWQAKAAVDGVDWFNAPSMTGREKRMAALKDLEVTTNGQ